MGATALQNGKSRGSPLRLALTQSPSHSWAVVQMCNFPTVPSILCPVTKQALGHKDQLFFVLFSLSQGPSSDELSGNPTPTHIPGENIQENIVGPWDTYILIAHIPVWPLPKRHDLPHHNPITPGITGRCELPEGNGLRGCPSDGNLSSLKMRKAKMS